MVINRITIDSVLKKKEELYLFIKRVSKISEFILFGGSMRDLYFNQHHILSRDYDVVLDATEEE